MRRITTTARALRNAAAAGKSGKTPTEILLPRRAFLYLPGHDERKALKASTLQVDCVCLDCEDSVALSRKAEARSTIAKILQTTTFASADVAVRINPPRTPVAEEDLKALFAAPVLPKTLVVPKVNEPADLEWLFTQVASLTHRMKSKPELRLVTMVESALGLLNLRSIIEVDLQELTESLVLRHDALIFGGDDYAASIGATRSPSNKELLYARQSVVAHAKAYGLQAIDIVHINFRDSVSLAAEAHEGFGMGFTGKQIIHPAQVDVVQREFSPSAAQVTHAQAIMDAYHTHLQSGTGAFAFEGTMIDLPTIKQCETVLALERLAQGGGVAGNAGTAEEKSKKGGEEAKEAKGAEKNT